ncbi:hypothetical protein [Clostridium perfringens]
MYKCDKCKENFHREEVVFLCGNVECLNEEEGGSGDVDRVLCWKCYEEE